MKKQFLTDVAFYITNVCSMTCTDCISFNNYRLKNHYHWKNSQRRVEKWAKILDIGNITILGGEPFLHPDLVSWVKGIRQSFFNCKDIRVVTGLTGKQLLRYKESVLECIKNNVAVQISVHDPNWWDLSQSVVEEILSDITFNKLVTIDPGSFPLDRINYTDNEGNLIFVLMGLWAFFPNSQKYVKDGVIYLHDNDPKQAHNLCYCKTCQYIVDGFMYKCALTGVADVITKQLTIDERSKKILEEVQGIDPFSNPILDFSQPVSQCSLCSTNLEKLIPIYPLPAKKPKL